MRTARRQGAPGGSWAGPGQGQYFPQTFRSSDRMKTVEASPVRNSRSAGSGRGSALSSGHVESASLLGGGRKHGAGAAGRPGPAAPSAGTSISQLALAPFVLSGPRWPQGLRAHLSSFTGLTSRGSGLRPKPQHRLCLGAASPGSSALCCLVVAAKGKHGPDGGTGSGSLLSSAAG